MVDRRGGIHLRPASTRLCISFVVVGNLLARRLCSRLPISFIQIRFFVLAELIFFARLAFSNTSMRPSVKRPSVIIPRPTKASLARQSKIRNSILVSSTLKPIQNEELKTENEVSKGVETRRSSTSAKNNVVFKRRRSLHKLAVIVSGSSLDNSGGDGETLKQVVSFSPSSRLCFSFISRRSSRR